MAGSRAVHQGAAWFRLARRAALLAVGVVALVVLGTLAAFIVDGVEVTGPQAPFSDPCVQGQPNAFLSQGPDPAECQWRKALSRHFPRKMLVRVEETRSGAFRASATITTVTADPLVTMVQRGDGQKAATFSESVVGSIIVGNDGFNWSPPTVKLDGPGKPAVISIAGQPTPDQPPVPGTAQLNLALYDQPATVEVDTRHRVVAGLSEDNHGGKVTRENAHSLTVDHASDDVRISLQPGSPQPPPAPPSPTATHWMARATATAWYLLAGFAGMLLPAGAWLILFLAGRMGAFGSIGREPAWRRMERVLGAVVAGHLVISACSQLATSENNLSNLLFANPSLGRRLSQAMVTAGLWNPNQYPAVSGGIILLIAFALVTAAWNPLESAAGPRPRRVIAPVAIAAGIAGTVGIYAALAYATRSPVTPLAAPDSSGQASAAQWLPVEIPVVALCTLFVGFVASAWISGALAARTAPDPGLTGREAVRFPRTRGVTGSLALLLAAGLIAAGTAAAVSGNEWGQPGWVTLIACLFAAASLALAAVFASRPWHSGTFLNRVYWAAALIAVLAVTAPLTNDNGYGPVVLRWGIVIIAGAFMGLAVARLAVAAGGPLRPASSRLPHLLTAICVAAVIAVPWGQLGSAVIEVDWWDLLNYANRIDGVLPLILTAAGVILLRRTGQGPVQDETTLSVHRRIGIAAWIVVLSGSYTFSGATSLTALAALAAAAIAAWLLMPSSQLRHAAVALGQSAQETAEVLRRALEAGIARRTIPALAKAMREDVAAGKKDFAKAQKTITALEKRAAVGESPAVGQQQMPGVTAEERAFGMGTSTRPWARARWGAVYGAAAGAPWVLLGLAGASVPLGPPEGYPELALISAVAPLALRWTGYGLLFGYFYPLLRGKTGLAKSISFFAAAVAPSVLTALASAHPADQQWHSAVVLALQLLIFALTMGLLTDLAVLLAHGYTAGRLIDLHSLWTVSAWASSIAVAVATGVATIILAGLQPFVIGVITPHPPSSPPAATSHP